MLCLDFQTQLGNVNLYVPKYLEKVLWNDLEMLEGTYTKDIPRDVLANHPKITALTSQVMSNICPAEYSQASVLDEIPGETGTRWACSMISNLGRLSRSTTNILDQLILSPSSTRIAAS